MQRRFTVLRVVSTIFKVLAVLILVLGLLGACGMIALGAMTGSSVGSTNNFGNNPLGLGAGGALGGAFFGVGVVFVSLLYFLMLYAFGDIISLLISLEENTRMTAERLTQASLAPVPHVSSPLPPSVPPTAPLPPVPPSAELPPAT